jgi:hypothetical protein
VYFRGEYSDKADIYSYGMILYEMAVRYVDVKRNLQIKKLR